VIVHIAVVYESMFGNTRQVAEAIADALGCDHSVSCHPVGSLDISAISTADLLIVGAPTHTWSLSRPSTRQEAAKQAGQPDSSKHVEPGATGIGIREWLAQKSELPPRAAVFDTRRNINVLFSGRASRTIRRVLSRRHISLVTKTMSFLVNAENRLIPGERERAAQWGRDLGRLVEPREGRGHRSDLL